MLYGLDVLSQNIDSLIIKNIYNEALISNDAKNNLEYLTKKIGPRLCASPQAAAAVEWSYQLLKNYKFDTVYLQETKVVDWKRGKKEQLIISSQKFGSFEASICALGGSVGFDNGEGITAKIIEVGSFEELQSLGETKIKGNIVFFNVPMDNSVLNTFIAYSKSAKYRVNSASEAAKYGAVGVIVRSLSMIDSDNPHTGIMRYKDDVKKIPCAAISTNDANKLSKWLKYDKNINAFYQQDCRYNGEAVSYNVIAELKGISNPENIILVGGHLDSWDNTDGAHDDGAGCIHSIEVLRIFKQNKIKNNNTIRLVLFMDEEFAQRGGKTYAEYVKEKNEKHIVAIESDAGGFMPIGFSLDASDTVYNKVKSFENILNPFINLRYIKGWGGVDIRPLKDFNIPLVGVMIESQRYFDFQHSAADVFEAVNIRELQMGSATIASLVYLIDKYGIE